MANFLVMTITALCLIAATMIMTKEGLKQIKDLKRGDLILTKNGYVPLAKNLIMPNEKNEYEYVKIPKGRFGSVPSEDLFISPAHPFSLGFKNPKVKDGKVTAMGKSINLTALELSENVWGIEKVVLKDEPYYNLIFDQEEEFSANDMVILSHHPNAENYQLPRTDFIGEINTFGVDTKSIKWSEFIKDKLFDETMEDFVERKLSFDRFNWLQYVNNYEDLTNSIKTEEEAVRHWLKHGKEEFRTSMSRSEILSLPR